MRLPGKVISSTFLNSQTLMRIASYFDIRMENKTNSHFPNDEALEYWRSRFVLLKRTPMLSERGANTPSPFIHHLMNNDTKRVLRGKTISPRPLYLSSGFQSLVSDHLLLSCICRSLLP